LPVGCISLTRSNDAIKLLETTVPDYIFVDFNMPVVNGIECIQAIKKNEAMAHVPVVIFSTTINDAIEQKAKAFGAVPSLKKLIQLINFQISSKSCWLACKPKD